MNAFRITFGLLILGGSIAANAQQATTFTSKGRKLAPDALHVIPPGSEFGETFQGPIDLPVVTNNPDLAWDPNFSPQSDTLIERGKEIVFRNDVYSLEFSLKPVRTIEVNGELVWYLLYRVRYLGGDFSPTVVADQFNNEIYALPKAVSAEWVRFFPVFTLNVKGLNLTYKDQFVPEAKRLIALKERVGQKIYDSIEMQKLQIPLSTKTADRPVWGVAMWRGVDPRTDFFTVEVLGLTNAQKIEQQANGLKYLQKRLVLNFSRPGDTVNEKDDRIRFGIPALEDPARQKYVLDQFGVKERLDYTWIYR